MKLTPFRVVLGSVLGGLLTFLATAAYLSGPQSAVSDADKAASSVMIVRNPGRGGGSGVIVETGGTESKVLTNFHQTGPLEINNLSLLAYNSLEADSQAMQLLGRDGVAISAGAVPEPSVPALLAAAWLSLAAGMWRKR